MTAIRFDNNSKIMCVPAGQAKLRGASIRGFSPNILAIDEAAFIDDDVFDALEPSLAVTKGTLIMASNTVPGKHGFFYNACVNDSYERSHIKAIQCPSYTKKWLNQKKREKDPMSYSLEYEAEFVDESENLWKVRDIRACMEDRKQLELPEHDTAYILGVDVARYGTDYIVFAIAEARIDKMIIVKLILRQKQPITATFGQIKDLDKDWHFNKIYIDESHVGGGLIDFLIENKEIKGKIVPVNFHLKSKAALYKKLTAIIVRYKLKLPEINDEAFSQLTNLKYKYTKDGILRVEPPKKGHDDVPDTLALLTKHFFGFEDYGDSGLPDDFIIKSS